MSFISLKIFDKTDYAGDGFLVFRTEGTGYRHDD